MNTDSVIVKVHSTPYRKSWNIQIYVVRHILCICHESFQILTHIGVSVDPHDRPIARFGYVAAWSSGLYGFCRRGYAPKMTLDLDLKKY